jgi:hypothetical protein
MELLVNEGTDMTICNALLFQDVSMGIRPGEKMRDLERVRVDAEVMESWD